MITTRRLGEHDWYLVTVHYSTETLARAAWERAEQSIGGTGLSVLRLGPALPGKHLSSGAPVDAHPVVGAGIDRQRVEELAAILADGVSWQPTLGFCDTLIARHARVALTYAGKTGRIMIRRPPGRGGALDPTGRIRERPGGDG